MSVLPSVYARRDINYAAMDRPKPHLRVVGLVQCGQCGVFQPETDPVCRNCQGPLRHEAKNVLEFKPPDQEKS